ncbi:SDR family NAD(P)-dependent oxidoreductase [Fibrisoma montanum]|uniref:SDR family NAD(P)-dependent oxidoreductase n=1 Tax=Fibrisoma montanum TaxID=2305895 RepID=A0A418MDS0_9BACT|nr:SDR family NAD(P)-dependent oxidoreductase [Fibrisoma montanum]RIV24948.1 SDR family NAD(P)-dependent oxidoreductase [Fibrisoma montanum]
MKQVAVLIGATAGIGKETARLLAREGYRVLLVGRNQTAGQALATELQGSFIQADVSLMSDVRRVADQVGQLTDTLDLIIHTADVLTTKRHETAEGFEVSIATNYYGRFLLNHLLLNEAPVYRPARIIHVAAAGFPAGKTFRAKFPVAATASGFTAHNIGQIANDFYGLALAAKLQPSGTKVNILNPGLVDTDIRRRGDFPGWFKAVEPVFDWLLRPWITKPHDYAQVVVDIATGRNAEADQSVLINRKGKSIQPSTALLDNELRNYVWEQTAQLTGLTTTSMLTN